MMARQTNAIWGWVFLGGLLGCSFGAPSLLAWEAEPDRILCSHQPAGLELLATREVQRYVYLRTGRELPLQQWTESSRKQSGIVLFTQSSRLDHLVASVYHLTPPKLAPGEFWVKTRAMDDGQSAFVCGGDATGTLYGAYRLAELMGVRFYLLTLVAMPR